MHCTSLLNQVSRLGDTDIMSSAKELYPLMRKLIIASQLDERRVICVSGLQGAGKTTLMTNFYNIDENIVNIALGRGERIPILITEKDVKVLSICAKKILLDEESNTYSIVPKELDRQEIVEATSGRDESIMFLEIIVPFQHTRDSSVSFMLLPGFEKKNDYWNDLIEFSINSSDAAVFVFSETTLSDADNDTYLKRIEKHFGKNVVYAITHSDQTTDDNQEAKETCLQVLKIPSDEQDRVVCVGQYSEKEKNDSWINSFKNAIEKYSLYETQSGNRNYEYIENLFEQLQDRLYNISGTIEEIENDVDLKSESDHKILRYFDRVISEKRKELERNIETEFVAAKSDSIKKIEEIIGSESGLKYLKRSIFGVTPKDFSDVREQIESSLYDRDISIPTYKLACAIKTSLNSIVGNRLKENYLLLDTEETEDGEIILKSGDQTEYLINDIRSLVSEPKSSEENILLQHTDLQKTVRVIAEISTYYYALKSHQELVKRGIGCETYEPHVSDQLQKVVTDGANSSKEFTLGILGIMGVDILGDGSLNLIQQLATTFSVGVPFAALTSVGFLGVGAATALTRDVNRLKRADYESARMMINCVYDHIQQDALDQFDSYVQRVRKTMETNIESRKTSGRKMVAIYNANTEIKNLYNLLDSIRDKNQRGLESYIKK